MVRVPPVDASLADFSVPGVLGTLAPPDAPPSVDSYGFPVVFGVLADPNDANAPEPSPKALAAPPGDTRLPPGVGKLLKGSRFVEECEDVCESPKRFANDLFVVADADPDAEPLESPAPLPLAAVAPPEVDRESLPELRCDVST